MSKTQPSSEKNLTSKMIPWHPLFNHWLKSTLTPADVNYNDEVYATSEPTKIDAVLSPQGSRWTQQQRALLPDGIRDRRKKFYILEFKITESVNQDAVEQAFSYDYLYRSSQNLSRSELQSYIISAKTTNAATLKKWGYRATQHPGVYVSKKPFFERVNIIVLNQLRDVVHNHYLQLFASQKKVRESAMMSLLRQHEQAFWANQTGNKSESGLQLNEDQLDEQWDVLYTIRKIYGMEGIKMETEMTLEEVLEIGRQERRRSIIESFSIEERIGGLEPQEIIEALPIEERIAGLKPQEIIEALPIEERIAGLKPQEIVAKFDPQEVVAELDPKDRVDGLDPKDRVDGLDPKDRMDGLDLKEIFEALEPQNTLRIIEEVEEFLAKQKALVENREETADLEISDEEVNTQDGVGN